MLPVEPGEFNPETLLTLQPNKDFTLGLTYAHSYLRGANNDGDVVVSGFYGSGCANDPFNSSATTPNFRDCFNKISVLETQLTRL